MKTLSSIFKKLNEGRYNPEYEVIKLLTTAANEGKQKNVIGLPNFMIGDAHAIKRLSEIPGIRIGENRFNQQSVWIDDNNKLVKYLKSERKKYEDAVKKYPDFEKIVSKNIEILKKLK